MQPLLYLRDCRLDLNTLLFQQILYVLMLNMFLPCKAVWFLLVGGEREECSVKHLLTDAASTRRHLVTGFTGGEAVVGADGVLTALCPTNRASGRHTLVYI